MSVALCHDDDDGCCYHTCQVRRLLRLDADQEFEISFECRVPGDPIVGPNTSKMELKGMGAYDAGKLVKW